MNDLRVPITLLLIIAVGSAAWFVFSRPSATPAASAASVSGATTSASGAIAFPAGTPAPLPPPDPANVFASIAGSWQSTNDQNYSIDILSTGEWIDHYKNANSSKGISETGVYTMFTSADPDPDFSGPLTKGTVYIKLVEGSDTYFYSVLQTGTTTLELSYLARGTTLSFVKEQ